MPFEIPSWLRTSPNDVVEAAKAGASIGQAKADQLAHTQEVMAQIAGENQRAYMESASKHEGIVADAQQAAQALQEKQSEIEAAQKQTAMEQQANQDLAEQNFREQQNKNAVDAAYKNTLLGLAQNKISAAKDHANNVIDQTVKAADLKSKDPTLSQDFFAANFPLADLSKLSGFKTDVQKPDSERNRILADAINKSLPDNNSPTNAPYAMDVYDSLSKQTPASTAAALQSQNNATPTAESVDGLTTQSPIKLKDKATGKLFTYKGNPDDVPTDKYDIVQ